jgi:hypothetical protein
MAPFLFQNAAKKEVPPLNIVVKENPGAQGSKTYSAELSSKVTDLLSNRPYLASAKYEADFKSELRDYIRFQATQEGGTISEFIGKIKDPFFKEEARKRLSAQISN